MSRLTGLLYSIGCYLAFHFAFAYLLGFLANRFVPKGIDDGAPAPLAFALGLNLLLLALFAAQHSVMARPRFKQWWSRLVPPPLERSTYVLATSLVLALLYWLWQPLNTPVWHLEHALVRTLAWGGFAAGALVVVGATFMIDHLDLFGLRQAYLHWRARTYVPPRFQVAWLYRWVRHPLYLGFFLCFWATPDMSLGHLLFAAGMSVYVLVAVRYEERDLLAAFGADYERYQREVPMVVPGRRPGRCPVHAAQRP